jgi:hypothetical protein
VQVGRVRAPGCVIVLVGLARVDAEPLHWPRSGAMGAIGGDFGHHLGAWVKQYPVRGTDVVFKPPTWCPRLRESAPVGGVEGG